MFRETIFQSVIQIFTKGVLGLDSIYYLVIGMGQMLNLSANKHKNIKIWIMDFGLIYLLTSGSSSRGGGLAGKPGGDLVGVPGNIVVGGVHGDAFQYELISGILDPIVWACC